MFVSGVSLSSISLILDEIASASMIDPVTIWDISFKYITLVLRLTV